MDEITIVSDADYIGEGISLGLARGLIVLRGEENLTGEGMGIGAAAARDGRATYFARAWKGAEGGLERTYDLDTRRAWSRHGRPSDLLTRGAEMAVGAYMRSPRLQPLAMRSFLPLRRAFGIDPVLEAGPSAARVTVAFDVQGGSVAVKAMIDPPARPGTTVCLLNELSADAFTASLRGGRACGPPPAWEPVPGNDPQALLYDPARDLRFGLTVDALPPGVPARVFWGRERTENLRWAGFCLELGPLDGRCGPLAARYTVRLGRGGLE